MSAGIWFLIITAVFILAIVVAMIANHKKHGVGPWFLYAICLAPIAFVHVLLLKQNEEGRTICVPCMNFVHANATICHYCNGSLTSEENRHTIPAVDRRIQGIIAGLVGIALLILAYYVSFMNWVIQEAGY